MDSLGLDREDAIAIAAVGICLADTLDMPVLDGVASILIGVVLAATAGLLAIESKSLLIGERASPELVQANCRVAEQEPGVVFVGSALTAQLSPRQALVALSVQFEEQLTAVEIESCVASMERRVKRLHPDVAALFVKPQTSRRFEDAVRTAPGRSAGRRGRRSGRTDPKHVDIHDWRFRCRELTQA